MTLYFGSGFLLLVIILLALWGRKWKKRAGRCAGANEILVDRNVFLENQARVPKPTCECPPNPSKFKFEYYQSPKNDKWYFRLKAANGKVVSSSRQGYENSRDLLKTIDGIKQNAFGAPVYNVTKMD